jgi:hypothetical protein
MTFRIPWGLILIFIALFLFYYINQKTKIRREERRDRLKQVRDEYLEGMMRSKKDSAGEAENGDKISND